MIQIKSYMQLHVNINTHSLKCVCITWLHIVNRKTFLFSDIHRGWKFGYHYSITRYIFLLLYRVCCTMIIFSVYEVMEYWCINKEKHKFYVFVPCKFEDEWKQ